MVKHAEDSEIGVNRQSNKKGCIPNDRFIHQLGIYKNKDYSFYKVDNLCILYFLWFINEIAFGVLYKVRLKLYNVANFKILFKKIISDKKNRVVEFKYVLVLA